MRYEILTISRGSKKTYELTIYRIADNKKISSTEYKYKYQVMNEVSKYFN